MFRETEFKTPTRLYEEKLPAMIGQNEQKRMPLHLRGRPCRPCLSRDDKLCDLSLKPDIKDVDLKLWSSASGGRRPSYVNIRGARSPLRG
jgi:hypothetical protein